MQTKNEPSPMLKAIDLQRSDLDQMPIQDLDDHAVAVLDTIAALNDYINDGQRKSHDALLNALRLNRKLCAHMARVRALIQARLAAQAIACAAPSSSAPLVSNVPGMGRRSRVIRSLPSADNAASGHIQISRNDPQGHVVKTECGGEAKEAGADPQAGEASLQAKR